MARPRCRSRGRNYSLQMKSLVVMLCYEGTAGEKLYVHYQSPSQEKTESMGLGHEWMDGLLFFLLQVDFVNVLGLKDILSRRVMNRLPKTLTITLVHDALSVLAERPPILQSHENDNENENDSSPKGFFISSCRILFGVESAAIKTHRTAE